MDSQIEVTCPACGETSSLFLESFEARQELVQDCPVCCRPWRILLKLSPEGSASAHVELES